MCSSVPLQNDGEPVEEIDPICLKKKPAARVCHISALNEDASFSNNANFKFTDYSSFTYDDARSVCQKIGGSIPVLKEELDAVWLRLSMEFLISYVSSGWAFSMKWITWPVRNKKHYTPDYKY